MSLPFEEHTIAALIHGRYLVDRGSGKPGRPLLVGFHGYGENAERHLEKLRLIPGADDWVLCAVGALHRFYNTKTGDVIGSWMTSQEREQAIVDNVRYVAGVVAAVRREEETSDTLVMAGFSQGVAMAYRAALRSGYPCHGLLILAGDVPPELAKGPTAIFPPILLGRGTEDEWYSEEKMDRDIDILEKKGADVTTCVFEGGHIWGEPYIEAAGEFLVSVGEAPGAPSISSR